MLTTHRNHDHVPRIASFRSPFCHLPDQKEHCNRLNRTDILCNDGGAGGSHIRGKSSNSKYSVGKLLTLKWQRSTLRRFLRRFDIFKSVLKRNGKNKGTFRVELIATTTIGSSGTNLCLYCRIYMYTASVML